MKLINSITSILILFLLVVSCSTQEQKGKQNDKKITLVASSSNQWTGIAVSKKNRVFVNFPKWSDSVPTSVAEIIDGEVVPYPSEMWNKEGGVTSFTAVQSVVCDGRSRLYVLDTNNPQFSGVLNGGPVLYEFDLSTDQLIRSYSFTQEVYHNNSYFNDVRIDINREKAFITDSGVGGIIVLDLVTGDAKRFLDGDKSVQPENDHLICDGVRWENKVASDGIALSPNNDYLYYTALSSHTLYRIKTSVLLENDVQSKGVSEEIEKVATIPATDGMLFDRKGNLWMGGLEGNMINVWTVDNEMVHLIKDERVKWADSFAKNIDREIYFTTSQIYLPESKRGKYEIYKLSMDILSNN
ncbi:SMP-30/gluconolactonase/LRE family protein [Flammeovirga kamogawensis]|uniref:SMP-30/gluconolactonase/LRE family protein n=1 Tax=Flammeovirga kamogawensis TaxID=373891 RepID=A0ABX8GXA4_9BACT|nr:L-dopachrome tautomerase-related protein [Flammeovirga kamogawensis]MBB6460993.1 sugar lactone lactonase YvrE [Flammeovirga kamogawensis]QWG07565.1 hypothetical protein KM029_01105 [Flammeovirga kamogawensis]TRX69377.1 hypothetical protein EO216_15045 [Flammeovirga kamogawensis]